MRLHTQKKCIKDVYMAKFGHEYTIFSFIHLAFSDAIGHLKCLKWKFYENVKIKEKKMSNSDEEKNVHDQARDECISLRFCLHCSQNGSPSLTPSALFSLVERYSFSLFLLEEG